jgi:hypothetical protein
MKATPTSKPTAESRNAAADRMNIIAKRLREVHGCASEQLKALGWVIKRKGRLVVDVYNDPAWYPDFNISKSHQPEIQQKNKGPKEIKRAYRIRECIIEIDQTLVLINHYAETYADIPTSDDADAIIEAFEYAVNAIATLFADDADIGRRQREAGRKRVAPSEHLQKIQNKHQWWLEEAKRLKEKYPDRSGNSIASMVTKNYNAQLNQDQKPNQSETVRQVLRNLNKKPVNKA